MQEKQLQSSMIEKISSLLEDIIGQKRCHTVFYIVKSMELKCMQLLDFNTL